MTSLYEDEYVDPRQVSVTAAGPTRNLIYIYVESMETTYASREDGGFQEGVNYIPNLTRLAKENLNFADVDNMGGFHATTGSTWTMGALLASTSGIPFAVASVSDMAIAESEAFLPGLTTLGEVLEDKGYVQEFMCGSDSGFAGRRNYFEQHGNYRIFDIYAARERGLVPPDYWVNWGLEDKLLFDIARRELTSLSQEGKPFNLTLLTVDLHATAGYMCRWCTDTYEVGTANVANCSDRLTAEFVDWCREQDFYENTTIIITGDHPRMDGYLVDGVPYYDRTVYNCIINPAKESARDVKSRTFTAVDLFPTILSAMGFDVEGDRLGLGTDLFSDRDTLLERLGNERLEAELRKASNYYVEKFVNNM